MAVAEHVGDDHEIAPGVDAATGCDHEFGVAMAAAVEGRDEHRVTTVRCELAKGFIGQLDVESAAALSDEAWNIENFVVLHCHYSSATEIGIWPGNQRQLAKRVRGTRCRYAHRHNCIAALSVEASKKGGGMQPRLRRQDGRAMADVQP